MNDYNTIFDILYDIKDKITDQQYFTLSNLIKSLYDKAFPYSEPIITDTSLSDSNSMDSSLFDECLCDDDEICGDDIDEIKHCLSFQRICEKNSILRNLYSDMEFDNVFDSDIENLHSCLKIHNQLFEKLTDLTSRTIILVSLFDYFIKNIEQIRMDNELKTLVLEKIEKIQTNIDEMLILDSLEFDLDIWKNHLLV